MIYSPPKTKIKIMNTKNIRSHCLLFLARAAAPVASGQAILCGTNYTQNFNTISNGLPPGWSVRTNATANSLGTPVNFAANAISWGIQAGQFGNAAGVTNSGLAALGSETADQQGHFTNRCPSVRQTTSFGDPGAAFIFQIANTAGLSNFNFSVDLCLLKSNAGSTTWTVDYAVGNPPKAFTVLDTYGDPGGFGAVTKTYQLGTNADNQPGNVWIRVAALSPSAGGTRDTFALDNFSLNCAGTPAAIPLCLQPCGTNLMLTWADSTYALQAAPTAAGTFTNVPGATSPFPYALTEPAKFFRLSR